MGTTPTVIPTLSGPDFADRVADLFPRGWSSDDAKQSGNVYAVFLAAGQQMQAVLEEIRYAANAQRLQTETFPELDLASVDYLGPLLPRPSGMSDADYAQAIIDSLFQTAATRPALQNALTKLTGRVPRMLEPWNIFDTGTWGRTSYWNVDTVANPARWGNGGVRYQGFIETVSASIPAIGPNNPIYGWGSGPLGPYWNVPGYFFAVIGSSSTESVYSLIDRLRAYGTIVWVKLVASAQTGVPQVAPGPALALSAFGVGTNKLSLTWSGPATGTPPFTYQVQFRVAGSPNWISGPSTSLTTLVVTGLTDNLAYEFSIITRNTVGSSTSATLTQTTAKVIPSPATNLVATQVQATAVTLTWSPPTTGSPPFSYTIQYRVTGTIPWSTFGVGPGSVAVTVLGLLPSTTYDFEVVTSNL